jgi:hypothetical protein
VTLRPRAVLTLAVGAALCAVAVPAAAGPPTAQATRHVLVVLSSKAPTVAVGHIASLTQLHPRVETVAAAEAAANSLGLSAVPSTDGTTLDVSGPTSAVDAAFGTSGHLGVLQNPLGSSVSAVLDPTDTTKVFFQRTPQAMTAGMIAQAYGGTQAITAVPTPDVASQPIVATIQLSGWNPASLTAYAQQSHVYADPTFDPVASGLYANRPVTAYNNTPNCQNANPKDTKDPLLDGSGQEETTLDQEAVLGVAPTLRQWTYTAANSGSCIFAAYQSVLDDVTAGRPIVALSTSWGSCESYLTNNGANASLITSLDNVLQKLVAVGVTITAATGDNGQFDCLASNGSTDTTRQGSDYPASSTAVLAVGGTQHNAGSPDIGWNYGDPTKPSIFGATGGGYSGVGLTGTGFRPFAKPSWQTGTGVDLTKTRELPDVSIDGDPASGISAWLAGSICTTAPSLGGLGRASSPCNAVYGGTSLSSPLMAASIAQLVANHAGGATAIGKGLLQPLLYKNAATVFTDVTAVNDPAHTITFPVGAGYDEATGLGVPSFTALDAVLFAPAPTIVAPATSAVGTIPLTIAAPAGVTIVAWFVGTANEGCTGVGAPTAPASLTRPDGVYTITVRGLTSDGRCTDAGVAHVIIDSVAPTLTISSWKRTEASSPRLTAKYVPSDNVGLVGVTFSVVRNDTKKVVSIGVLAATARQVTITGLPGKRYTITLTPHDALRPGKAKTAGSTLPMDDRKATVRGSWAKKPMKGTYLGTITRSETPRSTISATVTGSTVGVLVAKVPNGGKARLLVDGRVKKTIDLSAKRTVLNQSVTVKVASRRHKVTLQVLGLRGATNKGTLVTVDGFVSG